MKQMCLGTMITLIYQSRKRSADKIKDVCAWIFAAYDLDIADFNKELSSHLKSGHDPVPTYLINKARNLSIEEVANKLDEHIQTIIHPDKHKALFRAIKAILKEDKSIQDSTVIGVLPGFTKEKIIERDSFYESMTLANLLSYSITSVENEKMKSSIREIDKNYVDGFINSKIPIYFLVPQVDQDEVVPLKRTLKDPRFDRIFKKAGSLTISGLTNTSTATIFYVDPTNCKFRFDRLKDFIIDNIGSYVFSRAQVKRITDQSMDKSAIGSRAMLKFIQAYGKSAETVLGEILLYVFLEQGLGAPKIMSKIEIDETNRNVVSKSDGVHLVSIDKLGQPFHQLVFGASDIVGDLKVAVDRAFEKIISIEQNSDQELRMIDNTTQWTIYDPDATQYMVELMKPQRAGSHGPDMAFGAFLGYTIKLEHPETDSQKYRVAVKDQLLKDITNLQPYIIKKIQDNGLSCYSFYFYTFPFNDAPNEKTSIIQEMLSGGTI